MSTLVIKSGTTSIAGSTIKGSFCYFSGSTKDLGPTSVTGFYSGIDAPTGGYTVYQIGGSNGWTARVATDTTSLNSILISAGGTGSTVDQNITWATNTNSVYINSGATTFNFTIQSTIPAPEFSVTGISGFTSTPAFTTPIVGYGSFSSIGTPTGTLSFGFNYTLSIGYSLIFTLYKNGVDAGGSFTGVTISGTVYMTYSPLSVSPNDTIFIQITTPD